jgi:hypothetical protein
VAKSPEGGHGHEEEVLGVLSEQVDPVTPRRGSACRVYGTSSPSTILILDVSQAEWRVC